MPARAATATSACRGLSCARWRAAKREGISDSTRPTLHRHWENSRQYRTIRAFLTRDMIESHAATNATKTYRTMPSHEVHCKLAYLPEQLFDLAADVEGYPEFLPWWVAARVRKREGNVYYTDQVVRFAMVRKRFGSKTILQRPERIDVTSIDGPVRKLHLMWLFEPLADNGCRVALVVDLELRSKLAQDLFRRAIIRTARSIMSAFEARAQRLYGPAPSACTAACERDWLRKEIYAARSKCGGRFKTPRPTPE